MLSEDESYILTVFTGLYGALFKAALERSGYTVRFAYSADEIIAKMKEARPIFVICYVGLSNIDGLDLIQSIRAIHEFSDLPVLAVIPEAQNTLAQYAEVSGASKVLILPFTPNTVVGFANSIKETSELRQT